MATTKNKFREKPVDDTIVQEPAIDKNDIEETVLTSSKNKSKASAKNTNASAKKTETKSQVNETRASLLDRWNKALVLYRNERTQKLIGLLLMMAGVYLFIALLSYIFTWEKDQDKVLGPMTELFALDTKVFNWLGKSGALVSHLFMYKGFGVASFILVPVLIIYGLQKVLNKQITKPSAFTAKWLFFLVWTSLVAAFFFHDKLFYLGGGYGYILNIQLSNYVGSIGTLAILAFSMLAFLVLSINLNFNIKKDVLPNLDNEDVIEQELEEKGNSINPHASTVYDTTKEPVLSREEEAALLNFEVVNTQQPIVEEPQPVAPTENILLDLEVVAKPEEPKKNLDFEINNPGADEIVQVPEFVKEEPKQNSISLDDEVKAAQLVEEFGQYDPTLDLGHYQFPSPELLIDYGTGNARVSNEELTANKDRIVNTLKNYGIEIDKISATVGPTVTLYEIVPAAGVRISKIKNLEDDIALSLAALGIRIIAPIPGRGTIGIEVPNQTPEMVPMRNIIASDKFQNTTHDLPIALGKTINNEIFIADLAKMPHLLMAGATGQGKSVGLNAILVSLLYKKHPAQIKFVLVDPKKVELTLFNKIERHFLAKLPNSEDAIITDNTKVIHTLNSLCIEMDNRYALLQDAQVRNIKEYNVKFINRKLNPNEGHKYLPYIVLVVDEFADLIMTAGKEVETPIARLAQLARAIGIHLIIATQRPSVNIITGTIKANFPARIAFRVTSKIDSRTILDAGGAEQLIGRGDMLLSTGNDLIRIQCAFVDTPEAEKITDFIGSQRAYPSAFLLPEYVGEDGSDGKEEIDLSERDKMFDEAAKLVVQFQQGSASFLQRKLKLGYNRAGRIVDQLEAAGIIGQFEGSKAREVKCKDMAQLDEIIRSIKE
ncbi:MAG: cell division protein FtsK/SpoIIIE [Bacteroidota bacterium]|jgi:S-DNA-T family DNA segregation ATPase FtsK/SpoIIIE|nr:cell division protein FtsK/SpoIIIE [Bacteroidota bacterium]